MKYAAPLVAVALCAFGLSTGLSATSASAKSPKQCNREFKQSAYYHNLVRKIRGVEGQKLTPKQRAKLQRQLNTFMALYRKCIRESGNDNTQ